MAGGEVIGAAIGITLLIIVAYVIVGGVLFASDTAVFAQRDAAIQNEIKSNTRLEIPDSGKSVTGFEVSFNIRNTGNEPIPGFKYMDIVARSNCNSFPVRYNHNNDPNKWSNSTILIDYSPYPAETGHLGMFDPGEIVAVNFTVTCDLGSSVKPVYVTVISDKGSTASATIN